MTSTSTARGDAARLFAIIVLAIAGYGAYLGLPVILGALARASVLTESQLGWIASVELLALMVGSLAVSRVLHQRSIKLVLPAIILALGANLLTGLAHGAPSLFALRALAGFAGGACYAVALARLSAFGDPTKNASWFTAGVILGGSVLLVVLPAADARFGLTGVFCTLGLSFLLAAGLAVFLPDALPVEVEAEASILPHAQATRLGWLMMVGVFLYNVGFTSFWAYAERLGQTAQVPHEQIGAALSVSNLISAFFCGAGYVVGRRWGLFKPQILMMALVGLIFATWSTQDGAVGFWIRTVVYFQCLAVAVVLQLSLVSSIDRSGRFGALLPAAQGLGQAIGPAIGGYMLGLGHGYRPKLIGEGAMLLLTAGIAFAVYLLVKRYDPDMARGAASPVASS